MNNYQLKFLKNSTKDLISGLEYYKIISKELEDKFYANFKVKLIEIKENPYKFQQRYKGIRIAHIKKFPYSIHFIVKEQTIFIYKILHQHRYYK